MAFPAKAVPGAGPQRGELEALATGLPVTFLGHVADVRQCYRGIVVVPSIWAEAFGLVAIEAMACGVPVVAAAATGSQSLVDDGVSGRRRSDCRTMRILLVEDDPVLGVVLRRGLQEDGYAVDLATSVADGRDHLAINEYDAAVLDLGLPGKDGMEVLQALRAARNTTPVLVLRFEGQTPAALARIQGDMMAYCRGERCALLSPSIATPASST